MMNIEDLTLKQMREIAAVVNCLTGSPPEQLKVSRQPLTAAIPVIVCTRNRNVFFGYTFDDSQDVIEMSDARVILYWETFNGIGCLCE